MARHKRLRGKLGRPGQQRLALFRSLLRALFIYERIETTQEKAKQVRSIAEKIITLAKQTDLPKDQKLHRIRQVAMILPDKTVVKRIFDTVGPRFNGKQSGYTLITPIGRRRGDAAPVVALELALKSPVTEKQKKPKAKS